MTRSTPLAPMIGPDAVPRVRAVRSPKTAELVAGTLRRMVVDGQLKEGDFLPNEAELMAHFAVSRPTLREAVRVLESERLVEVRRGSRTGARVRVPGPEIVARPAGLLLELSGATIADVMVARAGIEPMAARLLAESGTPRRSTSSTRWWPSDIPAGWQSDRLAETTGEFHRRMVELSGNATLGDHRGHAARDHRAAHRIRLQGRPPGVEGGLRQADAVLRSIDAIVARRATAPRPRHIGANTWTSRENCRCRDSRTSRSATSWARGLGTAANCGEIALLSYIAICAQFRRTTYQRAPAPCRPRAGASPCRRL